MLFARLKAARAVGSTARPTSIAIDPCCFGEPLFLILSRAHSAHGGKKQISHPHSGVVADGLSAVFQTVAIIRPYLLLDKNFFANK